MVTIMTALWFEQLHARRPGVGQAARLAGAARDQLPARRARRVLPHHAARVRRPAELPEPVQGPRPGRLLDRLGRASAPPRRSGARWPAATSTRMASASRRAAGRQYSPGRRRRARRGRRAGRRSSTRRSPSSARSSGSSTSTGSRWTGWCRTSPRPGCRGCSPPPAGRCITVKYGRLLEELFARPGRRRAARAGSTTMPNPEYQRLLRCPADELRERLPGDGAGAAAIARLLADLDDDDAARRDPQPRRARPRARCCDAYRDDRRHPADGDLRLHDQGLRAADRGAPAEPLVAAHRGADRRSSPRELGADPDDPVGAGSRPARAEARLCRRGRRAAAPRAASTGCDPPAVPADFGRTPRGTATTQAALGRALLDLTREAPEAARRVVTRQPGRQLDHQPRRLGEQGRRVVGDRAAATGSPTTPRRSCTGGSGPAASTSSSASPRPTWSGCSASSAPPGAGGGSRCCRSGCSTTRSSSARWSRGRSASTPAASRSWSAPRPGSRSPPRAARTSRSPRRRSASSSPAASATSRRSRSTSSGACWPRSPGSGRPDGSSTYLRLSTRPVDQTLAAVPADPAARERRRRQVVAGGYPLRARRRAGRDDRRDGRAAARGAGRRRPAGRARASPPTSCA